MTDKKKKYLAPEITVIEIEQTDIIATSGDFVLPTDPAYTPDTW